MACSLKVQIWIILITNLVDEIFIFLLKYIWRAHMSIVSSKAAETLFMKPAEPQQRLRVSGVTARCIFFPKSHDFYLLKSVID